MSSSVKNSTIKSQFNSDSTVTSKNLLILLMPLNEPLSRYYRSRIYSIALLVPLVLAQLACTITPAPRVSSSTISQAGHTPSGITQAENLQPTEIPASAIQLPIAGFAPADDDNLQALQSWFIEARNLVSSDLKIDLSFVDASVVGTSAIRRQARHSLLGALSHDIKNNDFAESLVDNMLSTQTASVLAIYSPLEKAILLHRDNLDHYLQSQESQSSLKASMQALLIHELIHAADDVRFEAFDRFGVSYQEVFAKSTIVEGHAQWHTRRLCQIAGCSSAFASLNEYMFDVDTSDDPALQYIQNRSFKNLEFVYREGERFIDQLMKKPNGQQLVTLAFEQPPRDSIQIIDPDSFPNRDRESRNLALSTAIKQSAKPWADNQKGHLRRNVLAAAAFSVNPEAREPIVDFYTSKILAAAKHEYYDRTSEVPIPLSVIALQTSDVETAHKTAALIFDSTTKTYSGLTGDYVSLNNWTTATHTATANSGSTKRTDINLFTASGDMINDMVSSSYPVEVVTATSGNFVVHIDGRYKGSEELMQLAGQLLINLQNQESAR